ncbi:alpha/beta hydrolase family protein [Plantactinospora sp. CA-290183]|uniref:alpha/beta hydrolase family protein n=1 Tax=Plantactinospora sp. CA-290183 TaxID=3240006 RepID=UPI003D8CAF0C
MRANRLVAGLSVLLLSAVALTACGWAVAAPAPGPRLGAAPDRTYAVGVRTLELGRGTARPLPVTIWYPTLPEPSAAPGSATSTPARRPGGGTATRMPGPRRNAAVAPGRFPIVLFSHGLHSLPDWHAQLTMRWAAAGFVVAAPAYPHTRSKAPRFDRGDVRHQPGDAWRVIRHVSSLDRLPGDRFAGHLDVTRVGAAGHSAGGFTTAGLFTSGHSEWLRSGIVIAGGGMAGAFAGPPAALLFVHGGADATVSASTGREAYRRVRWPKAFLTLTGQGHGEYLTPGRPGFDQLVAGTTNFFRWTLYADPDARPAIPAGVRAPGVTEFADALG